MTKRPGYSLIELAVVLGVIALLGAATLPTFSNSNSRGLLDSTANKIKQALVDARVRSLAPNKSDGPQTAQVYQVVFSNLPSETLQGNKTANGNINTNTITLQRGLAQCGQSASQGGFTTVRSFKTPRGIYLSSFYPYDQSPTDIGALVRFTVGQLGFQCGSSVNPSISSTSFGSNDSWSGRIGENETRARYLVMQLATSQGTEKRYISVDRLTSEVTVSRTNPQQNFQPISDELAPRWNSIGINQQLSVVCNVGTGQAVLSLSFPRAKDRYDLANPNLVDPNRLVYYDISWSLDSQSYQPIAIKYFHRLDEDTVRYNFTTTAVTGAQPNSITFQVVASDELGRSQLGTLPLSVDTWRRFTPTKPSGGWCTSSTGISPGGGNNIFTGGSSFNILDESGIPPPGPPGGGN